MAGGQTYNQFTKCVASGNYYGLYTKGIPFILGLVGTLVLLFLKNPSAAVLTAILTAIGYCQWWLYYRLVCLGNPNACMVGLVLRVDTQGDQDFGPGKFDTDLTLYLLPLPNPLIGTQNWYNDMNNPTPGSAGVFMQDQSLPSAAADPSYVTLRNTYTTTTPYGFSGETITGPVFVNHDNQHVMTAAQAAALGFYNPPDWQANYVYNPGDTVQDSNGNVQVCLGTGVSGASPPNWFSPDKPALWQASLGATTDPDGTIGWSYNGPARAAGILEVEFEGAGVWNLYQALIAATPVAAAATFVCSIPFIGWVLCLILTAAAVIISGVGAVLGLTDSSAETDVANQVGTLVPGVDVLFVVGTWVWDGGHIPNGWNELHPVVFAQRIATVPNDDLIAGNPWQDLPAFDTLNLPTSIATMCGLASTAMAPGTRTLQQLPQNAWTIHPLVDGCTPAPIIM